MKFTSCIASNMNSSVFQYYVKMAGYDAYSTSKMGGYEDESATIHQLLPDQEEISDDDLENLANGGEDNGQNQQPNAQATTPPVNTGGQNNQQTQGKVAATRGIAAKVSTRDGDDLKKTIEKFYESTYNKNLSKLKSQFGDLTINAESAVLTIRKVQGIIRQSLNFLNKLYGAPSSNLWYKEYEKEELYTTLEPDHRQRLKRQYREKFDQLRGVSAQIEQ